MQILLKLFYRITVTLFKKSSRNFIPNTDFLNFKWRGKGTRITQMILKNKKKYERHITAIKTVWY